MFNLTPSLHKIPTLLGLALVLVFVAVLALTLSSVGQLTKLFSSATTSDTPLSGPTVANFTDISATIYWTTNIETNGVVYFGPTAALGQVAVDDRTLANPDGKFFTHFVTLTGLKSQTQYFYLIGSNQNRYGDPNANNNPFTFTTGPTLTGNSNASPLYGKVQDFGKSPLSGAIVSWTTSVSSPLAVLTKNDGSYVLPLSLARTSDLTNYASLSANLSEKIFVDFGASGSASLTCQLGTTALPDLQLGDTKDCSNSNSASKTSDNTASNSASFTPPPKNSQAELNITDGQTVTSPLPTIEGSAQPGQTVQITIHSDQPFSGTVVAGPDGSWSWTPPSNLSPGQHTVTITVTNADGTTQTVTRTFYVPANSPILPITSGTPSSIVQHKACVNNTCSLVTGSGTDMCVTDADCAASVPATHKECQSKACISVPGAGSDQCTSNLSCQATTPPPKPPSTGSTENTLLFLILGITALSFGSLTLARSRH